jgi:murein DD-endopeptidase MepM/ murein hydrolase activator NlpD
VTLGPRRVLAALAVSALIGGMPAAAFASAPAPAPSGTGAASTPVVNPWVVVLPAAHRYLHRGDAGAAVLKLQKKLWSHHRLAARQVTGRFGVATQNAVRVLQHRYREHVNGVAGVAFLTKIGLTVKISAPAQLASTSTTTTKTRYLRTFPIRGNATHPYSTTQYPYADVWGSIGPALETVRAALLPAAAGTPVVAPCNGTVVDINPTYGTSRALPDGVGGWYLTIEDVTGTTYRLQYMSGYAHGITAGAHVTTGQTVGYVGATGEDAGSDPELYLQVTPIGHGPVDPFADLSLLSPPGP